MTTPERRYDQSKKSGIGAVLRATRATRGVSLSEIRARTKIDVKHLAAFEADRFEELPPFPFARGFLRTYAKELGLDPEPLLTRLSEEMAAPRSAEPADLQRPEAAIVPAHPSSPLRRTALSVGGVALVGGIALVVFFIQQVRELDRPIPAATPTVQTSPADPQAGATSTPAAAATTAPEVAAPAPEVTGITVDVQALGRSWIRVLGEEGPIYEGIMTAGQSRRWQSDGPLTVRLGNAGAVVVTVNGRTVGALGRRGQVVSRTFHKDTTP